MNHAMYAFNFKISQHKLQNYMFAHIVRLMEHNSNNYKFSLVPFT